ncbi:MAG: AAA family ATPase [Candidatus Competibacteraceae bacterium]
MNAVFDSHGQPQERCFQSQLWRQTGQLTGILAAAAGTHSARVESTHFLMALAGIPAGFTQTFFRRKGFAPQELEQGLAGCASSDSQAKPPRGFTPDVLDDSARRVIAKLESDLASGRLSRIDEASLLLATLEQLTPRVAGTFEAVQLDPQELIDALRKEMQHYTRPVPFAENDAVRQEAFTSGGRRVLSLLKTEAEALGYTQMDPRHLLLALLEFEGGATQMALYQQDVPPRKVQERLMINLRGRAQKNRSRLDWNRRTMSDTLSALLERAAEETQADRSNRIAEVHLLRALLKSKTFAVQQLTDAGVDLVMASQSAQQFKPEDEVAPADSTGSKSLEAIKAELESSLVGQQDTIEMCLPFIRRMLFDFRRPGKPAGVFLFCGPSGVGKTEMAKAIARAVFGGEDNLIMLEMGQFQTKESMNIFVGAPPGYIGYGEGKLTNGLRDKPRSVVLFDEIEKAHPQVFHALLRFIDEGRIDDPAGPIRDGSECIIMLTSNVSTAGLEQLLANGGYKKNKWEIRRRLKEALLNRTVDVKTDSGVLEPFRFRPEFLNRIDEIILFRTLDEDDMTEIARRHLLECRRRLREEKQIELEYFPKLDTAARLIGRFCKGLDEGARAILRVVYQAALDPVIDFVNEKGCTPPVSLVVKFHDSKAEEPYVTVGPP